MRYKVGFTTDSHNYTLIEKILSFLSGFGVAHKNGKTRTNVWKIKPFQHQYWSIVQYWSTCHVSCVIFILQIIIVILYLTIAMRRCTTCAIDLSQGFWYDTLPCPFTLILRMLNFLVLWWHSGASPMPISRSSPKLSNFYICQLNVNEVYIQYM